MLSGVVLVMGLLSGFCPTYSKLANLQRQQKVFIDLPDGFWMSCYRDRWDPFTRTFLFPLSDDQGKLIGFFCIHFFCFVLLIELSAQGSILYKPMHNYLPVF